MHKKTRDVLIKPDECKTAKVEQASPLIPEGVYEAQLLKVELNTTWVKPRLYLIWRIIGGEHAGVKLFEAINAEHKRYKHTSKN